MKVSVCHIFSQLQKVLDGMVGEMYRSSIALANNLKNTLQAYPVACCRDAQTGGFIFLWRLFNRKPANRHTPFVGCGEERTASVVEMMRFAVLTTSYGSEDWREREPWAGGFA